MRMAAEEETEVGNPLRKEIERLVEAEILEGCSIRLASCMGIYAIT